MCANYETVEVELASFPQLKIRLPADRREIWATNFGAVICWSYEKGEPEHVFAAYHDPFQFNFN